MENAGDLSFDEHIASSMLTCACSGYVTDSLVCADQQLPNYINRMMTSRCAYGNLLLVAFPKDHFNSVRMLIPR